MTAKQLMPRTHSDFPRVEGFVVNFVEQEESTDEEMDHEDEDIIRRIDKVLNEKAAAEPVLNESASQSSVETRLLISQNATEILSLADQVPNGVLTGFYTLSVQRRSASRVS